MIDQVLQHSVEDYLVECNLPLSLGSLEYEALQEIISVEIAIHVVFHTAGGLGFTVDNLTSLRRNLINAYELNYRKYNEYFNYHI